MYRDCFVCLCVVACLAGCRKPEDSGPSLPASEQIQDNAIQAEGPPHAKKDQGAPQLLLTDGDRDPQGPIVARTDRFGNLRASDLNALLGRYRSSLRALRAIARSTEEPYLPQLVERIFPSAAPRDVVWVWLLARVAEEDGERVSDDEIREELHKAFGLRLDAELLKGPLKSEAVSSDLFWSTLRELSLARKLTGRFLSATENLAEPAAWDYYRRIHQKAKVELLALPVASFVDRVGPPGEGELREFFERYRTRVPDPASPEPGFKEPHRIALSYVRVDLARLCSPNAVTDAEIQRYREKTAPDSDQAARREIAEQKAREKCDALFQELRDVLRQHERDRSQRDSVKTDPNAAPLSALPDFHATALKWGVEHGTTKLLSAAEMKSLEIARTQVVRGGAIVSFEGHVFGRFGPGLFEPVQLLSAGGIEYLCWKTEEQLPRVPKYDETGVRDRVLGHWKLTQARRPALDAARQLAEEARRAGSVALKQVFRGRPAIRVWSPEPFSWFADPGPLLTMGGAGLSISTITDLGTALGAQEDGEPTVFIEERAGEDLMRAVYDLRSGEMGVAMNQPKTTVYVVRLLEWAPMDELLRPGFRAMLQDRKGTDYLVFLNVVREDRLPRWIQETESRAGFRWEAEPECWEE